MKHLSKEKRDEFVAKLLIALQTHRAELVELLAKYSSHWGYEDGVYRFYHQSLKVFALQNATEEMVATLRALCPERELNEWFREIVQAGTGHKFDRSCNDAWLPNTRPIVEAFFHARFMLEMAVRYASLEEEPAMLPSGWAALLYLYDLR